MSISKKEFRKYADPMQSISAANGLLYAEQIKYIAKTAIKNINNQRCLLLYIYDRAQAAGGDFRPAFTVFQTKEDFITLALCEDNTFKWRTALFDNLQKEYVFDKKCAFCGSRDEERVTRFCAIADKVGSDALGFLQIKIRAKQEIHRRHQRQKKIVERMRFASTLPRDFSGWLHREVLPQYLFFDYQKGKNPMSGTCTACEKEVQILTPKHNSKGICPHCKKEVTLKSRGKRGYIDNRATVQVIQKIADNELIIRIFKVYNDFHKNEVATQRVHEAIRIFVRKNADGSYVSEPYHTSYDNGDLTPWKTGYPIVRYYYQENFHAETCGRLYHRNLESVLMGTPWQYCQLKEFYLHDCCELATEAYFKTYLQMPALEYLVKLRLFSLAAYAVYGSYNDYNHRNILNMAGTNIKEVLGIEKADIPVLQACDAGVKELKLLQILRGTKHQPEEKILAWVKEQGISEVDNLHLPLKHTSPHKLIRYLEEQFTVLGDTKTRHGRQRFSHVKDVLREYKDYLRFCEELGYDLTDSFLLFPRDLPTAHDRASEMMNLKKVEQYDKEIADTFKSLAKQYQFRKNGLLILPPKSAQEIVIEGQKLHHCVGGYVSSVAKKECAVLFLRTESQPDTPYFTIEVKGNEITQARGDGNGSPPQQIKDFLALWSKKKRLLNKAA